MTDDLRVGLDDDGRIDAIVGGGCTVQLERLDDDAWYLGLTRGDATWQVWLRREGRRVEAQMEPSALAAARREGR